MSVGNRVLSDHLLVRLLQIGSYWRKSSRCGPASITSPSPPLKAIYLIQQVEDGPAATGAIADTLDVSPASANEMIGKLEAQGLVDHEKYTGVTLTDEGISTARLVLETY